MIVDPPPEPVDVVSGKPVARWLSAKIAAERLGVNTKTLAGLVGRRLLTCRRIPGTPPRYLQASVERLLEESTTLATGEGPDRG